MSGVLLGKSLREYGKLVASGRTPSDRENHSNFPAGRPPTEQELASGVQFGSLTPEALVRGIPENTGRLAASLTDEERAFLAKRFGVQEIPAQGPEESSEDYGKKVLGIIEASKANVKRLITNIAEGYVSGFYVNVEHAQSALDAVVNTLPEGSRASLNQFFYSELDRLTDATVSEEVASDDT